MARISEEATAAVPSFEDFLDRERPALGRVLVAHYGTALGAEVTADAVAYAWEHWIVVGAMSNRVGYLYRVAQSAARRHRRWHRRLLLPPEPHSDVWCDDSPDLAVVLARLTPNQRVAVLLVHAHGWSYGEAALAMNVTVAAVTNHVHRGMKRLRRELGGRGG